MGKMTTSKPLISIIWTCQEMMVWMSRELIGSMDVIWYDGFVLAQTLDNSRLIFAMYSPQIRPSMTSHGQDDLPKTID
jgi:hypothetical protein